MVRDEAPSILYQHKDKQYIVTTNLNLLGYLIIVMSFLRMAIDYWLKLTPESKD